MEQKTKGHTEHVIEYLDKINSKLGILVPDKPRKWTHKWLLGHIQIFLKYFALPSVFLASILPIYNLYQTTLESLNKNHIENVYVDYTRVLIRENRISSAINLLEEFEKNRILNVNTQFAKALTLSVDAIKRGSNLEEAEDTINILIKLHEEAPFYFPEISDKKGVFSLRMALVDIDLENGRYEDSKTKIDNLLIHAAQNEGYFYAVKLRKAILNTLEHRYGDAKVLLKEIIDAKMPGILDIDEVYFQYGKALMFERKDLKEAISWYEKAEEVQIKSGDYFGLIKVKNNLGICYHWLGEYDLAGKYYRESEALSRDLKDNKSLARALVNIATIERVKGNEEKSAIATLESLAVFEKINNNNGVGAASNNLINYYINKEEYSSALFYAKKSYSSFKKLKEIAGVASSIGFLGDISRHLGIYDDAVFYNHYSYILYRHTNTDHKMNAVKSILLSLKSEIGEGEFENLTKSAYIKIKEELLKLGRPDIDFHYDYLK